MAVLLSEELKAAGYSEGPESFRELLADLKDAMYRSWSDEELLVNSRDAELFCQVVRHRVNLSMLPNSLILRTLLNMRKNSHRAGAGRGESDR